MEREPKADPAAEDSPSPSTGKGLDGGAAEHVPTPRCPFCDSRDARVISLFGTQVMTMQVKCGACGSIYEASKY